MNHQILSLKSTIKQHREALFDQFWKKGVSVSNLMEQLVQQIDLILIEQFERQLSDHTSHVCILALGSYGRQELQPYSDIDLIILHQKANSEALLKAQTIIQTCWDIGLEISHQITTVDECADLASQDLATVSSLLDMRYLAGNALIMEALQYKIHPIHLWDSHQYFFAKQQEQKQRYKKYDETAYNLEPNVKFGPGGLRDIQILFQISRRHFGIETIQEVIRFGFLTTEEYLELIACQHYLWKVRFGLHALAGKREDRLLFDYQTQLATLFGYQDKEGSLAIEQLMKAYFKVIKRSRELNEILLQWFSETIVHHQKQQIIPLDNYFQLSNDYIEARHTKVFLQKPNTLLKIFLWIAMRPEIKGVRASTIRLIRQSLHLIDKRFIQSQDIAQIFMAILKTPFNPYQALQRMNRYGVLGYYLDAFAMVTGQMQYDLFHAYTVDQHTLFVIRNLGRFLDHKYTQKFPLCAEIIPTIAKRHILYLAALFHDIAKGRGGDHSEIGAFEAEKFARRHQLSKTDKSLLVWLVRNHLIMSLTAQRQDIYDPKVIQSFAQMIPEPKYLDYLYLLTVADICATNPALWNGWKDSLLKELYNATRRFFDQKKQAIDETNIILNRKKIAQTLLHAQGIDQDTVEKLWHFFKKKYFLHETPEIIALHTQTIIKQGHFPIVIIMPHHTGGGTEIFLYNPHHPERFSITTTLLNNHRITIQEALISTCENGFDMDTYIVLDETNQRLLNQKTTAMIQQELIKHLSQNSLIPKLHHRRITRMQAHFKIKPTIHFQKNAAYQTTEMFLIAADRPGLLAQLSHILSSENIRLHQAKIATAGERVEDMFYLSNAKNLPLTPDEEKKLYLKLIHLLGAR